MFSSKGGPKSSKTFYFRFLSAIMGLLRHTNTNMRGFHYHIHYSWSDKDNLQGFWHVVTPLSVEILYS